MEIITGVERRRRWRDEDKLRVLAEAEQPGARTSEVARRHDISRGLLWYWRRQLRQGRLAVPSAPGPVFLPVQVSGPVPPRACGARRCRGRSADRDRAAGRHLCAGGCGGGHGRVAARADGTAPVIPIPTGMRVCGVAPIKPDTGLVGTGCG